VGTEGCYSQNGQTVAFLSPDGGLDDKNTSKRTYSSDLYYGSITAFDAVNHKVIAKAVTDIEIRSGTLATAGVWYLRRCRTAGSSPITTRRSRSCGGSTSARLSKARR
jgi:hypothetical protein